MRSPNYIAIKPWLVFARVDAEAPSWPGVRAKLLRDHALAVRDDMDEQLAYYTRVHGWKVATKRRSKKR